MILQDEEEAVDTGDGWDDWSHGKGPIKPADQLELTESVSEGWRHCSTLSFSLTELKECSPFMLFSCFILFY